MAMSLSTARWLAPTSFITNIAAQTYGLLTHPSTKEIHDANLSFFSPSPYFVGGFFLAQQLLQLTWLYRLCHRNPKERLSFLRTTDPDDQDDDDDVALMVDYVPYYALGNFCIAAWSPLWTTSHLLLSSLPLALTTLLNLYYLFLRLPALPRLTHYDCSPPSSTPSPLPLPSSNPSHPRLTSPTSLLTHLTIRTATAISLLDLLHTLASALQPSSYTPIPPPSTTIKVLTGAGCGLLATLGGMGADFVFGACMVFDLIALGVGQAEYGGGCGGDWAKLLGIYAVGTAVVVGVRNVIWWPYVGGWALGDGDGEGERERDRNGGYEVLKGDDEIRESCT